MRQIVSPVEFIRSVEQVHRSGHDRFYEIGPGRILVNLLKNIRIDDFEALPSVNAKTGEVASLKEFKAHLESQKLLTKRTPADTTRNRIAPAPLPQAAPAQPAMTDAEDFDAFLSQNEDTLRGLLYQ